MTAYNSNNVCSIDLSVNNLKQYFSSKVPEPSIALVWENLSCDGQGSFCTRLLRAITFGPCMAKNENEKILSNVSGHLNFGEMTALMGPSGAGKSTLLNCLILGKNYPGVNGRIAVCTQSEVRTCLISQNDRNHLLPNLTVTEALRYASQIKNPYSITGAQHNEIVDELLDELDLSKAKHTIIDKCSGGQKKRIAIALELTPNIKPNFLFLDEPTSGLDSFSGFNVIHRMRNLAIRRGIAVVTVIHQPSFEIFSQFHNVYVLSKVGSCVFRGCPEELYRHLVRYKYIKNKSPNTNPADIIIAIASYVSKNNKTTDANTEMETSSKSISTVMVKSAQQIKADCENMTEKFAKTWRIPVTACSRLQIENQGLCSKSADFRLYTLWVLCKRAFVTSIWRQKQLIFIRLALHAIVVIILTTLYDRNLGIDDGCIPDLPVIVNCVSPATDDDYRKENIPQQNVRFQFFSLLFLMFAALMPTVLTFPAEIKLFVNEHRNGWYSTSCYYISKTLVEIPCLILFAFCYVYFLYWYTQQLGMENWYNGFFGFMSWRYECFLAVTISCCFIAQGLGFLIGILCVNSFSMAIILSSSVLLFLFLFSGFFVKIADMSIYAKWITNLSFIRFSFESLLIIIYGNKRCEFISQNIPAKSAILYHFDLKDEDLVANGGWIAGHLIVIRILAFMLLRNLVDRKFMKLPRSCPVLFNYILPWYRAAQRKIGRITLIVIKVCLIILMLQFVVGIIVLIAMKI